MLRTAVAAVLLLSACGRIAFDPLAGSSSSDGSGPPDGSPADVGARDAHVDGETRDAHVEAAAGDGSMDGAMPDAGVDGAAGDARVDGAAGDARVDGAGEDAGPEPLPAACEEAISVSLGTPVSGNNCDGGDRIDGCGPSGTLELVYRFTAPSDGSYTFRAESEAGVTFATGSVDSACTGVASCVGLLSRGMEAGETIYLAIEDPGGGCVDFTLLVE